MIDLKFQKYLLIYLIGLILKVTKKHKDPLEKGATELKLLYKIQLENAGQSC